MSATSRMWTLGRIVSFQIFRLSSGGRAVKQVNAVSGLGEGGEVRVGAGLRQRTRWVG